MLHFALVERNEETLILDSTVCERYGAQEGARKGYNPKKPGRPSHHPLKAGLGNGCVVNLWNRRGDTRSAHQTIAFYDQTCRELPPGLRIRWILADSGFGEEGFLEHVERTKQRYAIALRLTADVLSAIRGIGGWRLLEKGLEIAEVTVALSTWKQTRRRIVIRPHGPTRPQAPGKQPMLFRSCNAVTLSATAEASFREDGTYEMTTTRLIEHEVIPFHSLFIQ